MAVRDPLVAIVARRRVTGEGAPDDRPAAVRQLGESILGHVFARPQLLDEALTHRSAAQGNRPLRKTERRGVGSNERLEFVGDRVLGLVVAEWLVERFPLEQEGELGRRLAELVSAPVLAGVSQSLGLHQALRLSPTDTRAGVGLQMNSMADVLEAAIGALFLDAGLESARRFVRGAWAATMEAQLVPPKDSKTALQEWMMARGLPLPVYVVSGRSGPSHAPVFEVTVCGAGQTGMGSGASKREAEREAAADLLGRLTA